MEAQPCLDTAVVQLLLDVTNRRGGVGLHFEAGKFGFNSPASYTKHFKNGILGLPAYTDIIIKSRNNKFFC